MGRTLRFDDLDRPAMLAAGPLALALYVRAACWQRRHKTEGFVPTQAVPGLVADFPERDAWGERMVRSGLWLSRPGGWLIPEFSPDSETAFASKEQADQETIPIPGPSPTTTPREATATTEHSVGAGAPTVSLPRISAAASWKNAKWGHVAALAHMYNTLTPENVPAVETLSPERVKKAKRLLGLFPDREWWEEVFRQYSRSRFLRGRSKPKAGHESFRPDFDWLLSRNKASDVENAVRVHDGVYED